jgi:hypothetical protein
MKIIRLIDMERPVWYSYSNVGKRYHMFPARSFAINGTYGGLRR